MDVLLGQPFYIPFHNYSKREVHIPINMKIAQTANPPNVIHIINAVDRHVAPSGTNETEIVCIAPEISPSSKVTNECSGSHDVLAVNTRLFEYRKMETLHHIKM